MAVIALLAFAVIADSAQGAPKNYERHWRAAAGDTFRSAKALQERGHTAVALRPIVLRKKHPGCKDHGGGIVLACTYHWPDVDGTETHIIEYRMAIMKRARYRGKAECGFRRVAYHELLHTASVDHGSLEEGRVDWLAMIYSSQDERRGLCRRNPALVDGIWLHSAIDPVRIAKLTYGNWVSARNAHISLQP